MLGNRAGVVEQADTRDLKSLALKSVPVRSRSAAPNKYNPNQIFPVGNGFGLFVYFKRYEQEYFPQRRTLSARIQTPWPQKKEVYIIRNPRAAALGFICSTYWNLSL